MHLPLALAQIGIFKDHFNDAEPAVVEACRQAVDALVARGAVVVDIAIPHMHALSVSHGVAIQAEFALGHDAAFSSPRDGPHLVRDTEPYPSPNPNPWDAATGARLVGAPHGNCELLCSLSQEAFTKINLALAMEFKAVEVYAANTLRGYALDHLLKLFKRMDVLIMPTVGLTAPKLSSSARPYGESDNSEVMKVIKHIFLGNFLGIPCMQTPVGYHEGLPIGLQSCAAHWNDHHALRVAHVVEKFVLKRRRPPKENFVNPLEE